MKAAIIIKARFIAHDSNSVNRLKNQLRLRYGERANTICNLHTANYFADVLIPLYEEMNKRDEVESFLPMYNRLIADFPLAIFVNQKMTKTQLESEITSRVKRGRKYGIPTLNVHGIGVSNIKLIKDVLKSLISLELIYKEECPTPNSIVIHIDLRDPNT